jgi:CBS domain-containing protein
MLLVGDRMTKSPIIIKRDDSFQTALNLLRQGGVRHLPVMEGKETCRYPYRQGSTFGLSLSGYVPFHV